MDTNRTTTFRVTLIADSAETAEERIDRYAGQGEYRRVSDANPTTRRFVYDAILELVGDADAAWFYLTSYGMNPSRELKSALGRSSDRAMDRVYGKGY